MLQSLHVKNLALIEEAELEFQEGLNILTGETGAGKSVLIGSINLALGGKFDKEMLRTGADSALVELTFSGNPKVWQKLQEMDLEENEDGTVLLCRKMQPSKSSFRINGETVTAKQVKELAEVLIDIHGQHEHQSLLQKKNYLGILDAFCADAYFPLAEEVKESYRAYRDLQKKLEEETLDEAARAKELDFCQFEYNEISEAKLLPGEDEELEQEYRRMNNAGRITQGLSESLRYTSNDSSEGAGSLLSRALKALSGVIAYDDRIGQLSEQLREVDDLLSDYNRDLESYLDECEFDQEDFQRIETRLNELNRLKGKYGRRLEDVIAYGESRRLQLEKLADYDCYLEQLKKDTQNAWEIYRKACDKLTGLRKKNAVILAEKLKEAMVALNFLTVEFSVEVTGLEHPQENGMDSVDFLISTNPGEPIRSLSQVASGGELSRIMLAIKTVLAGKDDIDTLIFDEIDAGISGKTAWKVSEQLNSVAKKHQVLCITHLPQIAAMADYHYMIEKHSEGQVTTTQIHPLKEQASLEELARLLGSDTLTRAALENASEMRKQALAYKAE